MWQFVPQPEQTFSPVRANDIYAPSQLGLRYGVMGLPLVCNGVSVTLQKGLRCGLTGLLLQLRKATILLTACCTAP